MNKHERCVKWMNDVISTNDDEEVFEDARYILELLEKAEPKRPKQLKGYEEYICSECSALVGYDEIYHGYCPNCGQVIDWSDENA